MLIILECKDYNSKVPVNDIEEFHSKLNQVRGSKGILVSSNAFQEGTFFFAQTEKIGLLRYRDIKELDWVLTRSPSSLISNTYAKSEELNVSKNLRNESFENNYFDCNTFFNYNYTNSLQEFITNLIENDIDKKLKKSMDFIKSIVNNQKTIVPFITDEYMEQLTLDILSKIEYEEGKVRLDDIIATNNLKVLYKQNLGAGILGEINFNSLEIFIDNNQCETLVRRRFTTAHELGHYFLGHSQYMLGEKFYKNMDFNLEKPFGIGITDIVRLEWQANQFASYLLLPKEHFLKDFLYYAQKFGLENKGFGFIFLDKQQCNQDTFIKISSPLMQKYKVSRSVVKIRLKKLGLLNGNG